MLILNGIVQIVIFLVSFNVLVPIYGTLGMAISILIAYLSSSLLLIILIDHKSFKYITMACFSIVGGFIVGSTTSMMIGNTQQLLVVFFSVVTSIIIIFLSNNMNISETKSLVKSLIRRN